MRIDSAQIFCNNGTGDGRRLRPEVRDDHACPRMASHQLLHILMT